MNQSTLVAPSETAENTADREIIITRLLNAPRELVFQVWTDPAQVGLWWGPKGFTNTIHEMEVKPGGVWRFTMHGPDGTDYPNKIEFLEVEPPQRLVYVHGGEDDSEGCRHTATVTFEDRDGKTHVTLHMVFVTVEHFEEVKKYGAVEGGNSTLDCLEEYLAKL